MRTLAPLLVLTLVAAPPLGAQDTRPAGWLLRTDQPAADTSAIAFAEMAPGFHVTTGPAAIFWNPEQAAGGRYRVELEVHMFDPEGRREAFGLFLGGRDLQRAGQHYLYFVIRDGGEFLVKARDGRETTTLVDWTAHPAVVAWDDRTEGDASVLNVLVAEADEDEIRFHVNGQEVTRISRTPGLVEGIVGLRVNHRLNLHVSRLEVSPLDGG